MLTRYSDANNRRRGGKATKNPVRWVAIGAAASTMVAAAVAPTSSAVAAPAAVKPVPLVLYAAEGYDTAMGKAFQAATGIPVKYEITGRREGDIEKIYANATRALKELNWKPQYSLEDAMLHAWQWEKNYRAIK